MKVGFLVECGPKGADEQVLRFLVNTLRSDIDPRFATCGSKRVILQECGDYVESLFTVERCEKVFVVWDLWATSRGTFPIAFRSFEASSLARCRSR